MFEQAVVAMLQKLLQTDSYGVTTEKRKRTELLAGLFRSHFLTEEEWAGWRRERGYVAWAGRAGA